MTANLRIDFISDVSCPWCAIGLHALEHALQRLDGVATAEWHFHPFELNPQLATEGEEIATYLTNKYGTTREQQAQMHAEIRRRGAELGFYFRAEGRERIYNTFNAHRLLHWAGLEQAHSPDAQRTLKKHLLAAYFSEGKNPAAPEVLLQATADCGLDLARAQVVVDGDDYATEVRAAEQHVREAGIGSVPAIIINQRHLISGGQPVEVFEQALRKIAAEAER